MINEMLQNYYDLKSKKNSISDQMLELEKKIYTHYSDALESKNSVSSKEEKFKISIAKKESVKVDQELASKLDFGFNVERKFSKTLFNTLNDEQKRQVNKCLTTNPAKPSFKIEEL